MFGPLQVHFPRAECMRENIKQHQQGWYWGWGKERQQKKNRINKNRYCSIRPIISLSNSVHGKQPSRAPIFFTLFSLFLLVYRESWLQASLSVICTSICTPNLRFYTEHGNSRFLPELFSLQLPHHYKQELVMVDKEIITFLIFTTILLLCSQCIIFCLSSSWLFCMDLFFTLFVAIIHLIVHDTSGKMKFTCLLLIIHSAGFCGSATFHLLTHALFKILLFMATAWETYYGSYKLIQIWSVGISILFFSNDLPNYPASHPS
jgi:hypothetical protein